MTSYTYWSRRFNRQFEGSSRTVHTYGRLTCSSNWDDIQGQRQVIESFRHWFRFRYHCWYKELMHCSSVSSTHSLGESVSQSVRLRVVVWSSWLRLRKARASNYTHPRTYVSARLVGWLVNWLSVVVVGGWPPEVRDQLSILGLKVALGLAKDIPNRVREREREVDGQLYRYGHSK